jgi:hypothetical protein
MTKHHSLPRFITKNFIGADEKIYYYSKKGNNISERVPYYNQLQDNNFYSNKTLTELGTIFNHIIINPLFKDIDKPLEKNFDINLEQPLSRILKRIIEPLINGERIMLTNEETLFIKEYLVIQHLRTSQFKKISKEVRDKILKLPPNVREIVMEIENKRAIDPKEFVKKRFFYLNSKQRREKVKQLKKLLEKPDFLAGIRSSQSTANVLEDEIKKAEENFERIRMNPDKHSSEIIDIKMRNSLFRKCDLDNKRISFVLNETSIPFVLADTGLVLMGLDYIIDDNLIKSEIRVYLPIHPKILIELSP